MSLPIHDKRHLPQTTQAIVGSWRMERLDISPETIRDMQHLAEGKISLNEVLDGIRQRLVEK